MRVHDLKSGEYIEIEETDVPHFELLAVLFTTAFFRNKRTDATISLNFYDALSCGLLTPDDLVPPLLIPPEPKDPEPSE